jgi:hypothetical protein
VWTRAITENWTKKKPSGPLRYANRLANLPTYQQQQAFFQNQDRFMLFETRQNFVDATIIISDNERAMIPTGRFICPYLLFLYMTI